jgi:hypothetical protein
MAVAARSDGSEPGPSAVKRVSLLTLRRPKRGAEFGFLVLVLALGWSSNAAAYHDDDEHITDDTAWTLKGSKNWRLGLYKASVTVADHLELGTYLWPWIARTPSAYAKLRFLSLGPWHWAAKAGFFRLDTGLFDGTGENAPVFTVGTAELANTIELGSRHQISNNLVGTVVRVSGDLDDDTLRGQGQAGLTNLQYVLAYQYRISRTLALVVTGRYQLLQVLDGKTSFVAEPDAFTSIEVHATASDEHVVNFRYAFSIVPALDWSWQTFNFRLGLGYGNFNIPGVNFMINRRTPIPELDLYWTF